MDTNALYAFLRKKDKELILVVANFSAEAQNARVKIPAHAYEFLQIPTYEKAKQCIELLTDKKQKHALVPDSLIDIEVPANDAVI